MFSIVGRVRRVGLFGVTQIRPLYAAAMWIGAIASTQAQTDRSLGGWQLSADLQDYREPQMQLKGAELGLHWQSRLWGSYRVEADGQSGRLDQVPTIDSRWRALRDLSASPRL
jgi:hypothetical protein